MASFVRKVKEKLTPSSADEGSPKVSRASSLRRNFSRNKGKKEAAGQASVEEARVSGHELTSTEDLAPEQATDNGRESVQEGSQTNQEPEGNGLGPAVLVSSGNGTSGTNDTNSGANTESNTDADTNAEANTEANAGTNAGTNINAGTERATDGESQAASLRLDHPDEFNAQLIQASSTPILRHHSSSNDTVLDENATETLPLLVRYIDLESGDPPMRQVGHAVYDALFGRHAWKTFVALLLLVLVLSSFYFTSKNIEELLNQAVQPDVQSVSVLDISDAGVSVHVIGSVYVEYETIDSWFYRYVLKLAGLAIGGVTVSATDQWKVYVSGDNVPKTHVVNMLPPDIMVDLIDRRLTEIDFLAEATFVEGQAEALAKHLLQYARDNKHDPLALEVELVMESKVLAKWFAYKTSPLSIYNDVVLQPNDLTVPVDIDSFFANVGKDSVTVAIAVSSRPLPVLVSFGALEWDIALPDCNNEPSYLGTWESDQFAVIPNKSSKVQVRGEVDSIPGPLLEPCSDGISPFNKFTGQLFENNTVHVFVSATKSKHNQKTLPAWMYKVLSETEVELNAPIPPPDAFAGDLVSNYTVNSLDLEVLDTATAENDNLFLKLDASTLALLNLPFNNSGPVLEVSNVSLHLTMFDQLEDLLEVTTRGDVNASLVEAPSSEGLITSDARDVTVEVLDAAGVAALINDFLNTSYVSVPDWDLDLDELHVQLHLLSTTLKNLKLRHRSARSQEATEVSLVNRFFANLNTLIDQLIYVDSSDSHIEFLVDFQVSNPLNASLKVPNDVIKLDFMYNDTVIGDVRVKNIAVPRTEDRIKLSARVAIRYLSEQQRGFVEDFLSHIISAADGLSVGLSGSKGQSSRNNPGLGRLLEEVHLHQVEIPQIRFPEVDAAEEEKRQSPFLVGATIHIFKLEIELTVYNPVANAEIMARILSCQASYKGETLAHMEKTELLLVPPGVYTTPGIPIQVSQGIGADILRRALNGDLAVDVIGEIAVQIDQFHSDLLYHGSGLTAKVKL